MVFDADTPEPSSAVAVMVTSACVFGFWTPVTTPSMSTVATDSSDELHLTVR